MNSDNDKGVNLCEEYAWVVVAKRTGRIITPAGISFETEKGKCPEDVKVNPIYKDEYENRRVVVMTSTPK